MADFSSGAHLRDPSKQNRRHARVRVRMEAEFRLADDPSVHVAEMVDIGTGGIGLMARMPLVPGDRLNIKFRLEDQEVESAVVVSRASGKIFGVVFEDPDDPAVGQIRSYIQKKFMGR